MRDFSTLRILPRSGSTAWVERSRPCLAEPPAESPSTMNSSASAGFLTVQSASLPGRPMPPMADLRVASRALRAAARAWAAETALRTTCAASLRVLLEELGELGVDDGGDEALHAGVAELGLGLALELRVLQLDRDDGGQALADVLAREVLVLLLELALLARVAVERARERRAEARHVRAALVRVDVVGEREDGLLVGGVPLQRHLDGALVALALEEDDLLLDRVLVLVEVGDEVLDAALVVELGGARALAALVGDRDPQAAGEERGLAQALLERRELELERLEDVGVREEGDRRAGLARGLALLERALRDAALVGLAPDVAVAAGSRCRGFSDSALTTERPTPCRPPETL